MSVSRRTFLKTGAAAVAGLTIAPSNILGKSFGHLSPSDKLNILGVGIGGMGASDLAKMDSQNLIGLADVDWSYAKPVFNKYPHAKRYKDYRKMYDELGQEADAVVVATADHTHAIITADAITLGKHVYVEKPLTHSIYEARLLKHLAKQYGVVTQMGNWGASGEDTRKIIQWVQNGEIGEVRRVESFTDRPIWPQGLQRPEKVDRVPNTLDWDLFIGPAPFRPYNAIYHPWNWRGWWDFGTGALGDMACHILHAAFVALKLGYPSKLQGSSTALLTDCAPSAQSIKYTFPSRDNLSKVALPECEVYWYDGGIKPERPPMLPNGKEMNIDGGCTILYGSKDTLVYGCYGHKPYLLSGREPKYTPNNHEIKDSEHQMDFVRACKESPANRVPTYSDFSEACDLTEMVDIGVLAVRLQSLNKILEWNGQDMKFLNISPNETMKIMKVDGFSVRNGHPTFNKTYTEPFNALEFANELVKHNYRQGWKLPDMPR